MKAGELRYRIIVQKRSITRDEEGDINETWSDVVTTWASIKPIQGREYFSALAVNAEKNIRFVIRYRLGITQEMRILYNGQIFDIQSIVDIEERHRELEIVCKEVIQDITS
jgi:SPP1 family predicted phage head-tail adaptor